MSEGELKKKLEADGWKQLEAKEICEFGVRITIFSNGDTYVSTHGDLHILKARKVFT